MDRISGLLRRARVTGIVHPLDALSLATDGVTLPRCDKGFDVHSATQILRRHNPHLKPREAEIFANDINGMIELAEPDSAWHYTRYVLRQHSLGQIAWPEYLRVVALCCLCGRRLDAVTDCHRCSKSGSSQSVVPRWLIEAVPDWRLRAFRGLIGVCALLGAVAAGLMVVPH